jgi:cytidylate kinase
MHDIITGRSAVDEYRRHLIQVILAIARKSGVIVGRGAHLILANYKVFRVHILGSAEVCARRLVKQERIGLDTPLTVDEAKRRVLRAQEDNAAFVRQLFARDIDELGAFDLMVNTDCIPVEAAPDIILYAMERAGFDVSKEPAERRSHTLAAA